MMLTMQIPFVALLLVVPLSTLASEETGERKSSTLSVGQCLTIVDKVQEGGKYSEESIASTCSEEAQSQKCEFFAEALSLASGHTDFEAKHFCSDITEAHFCSATLDNLLASEAVSDLAYGSCMRARPAKGDTYCHKFKLMLASAVNSTDLDTMRACYMMQAYAEGKEGADENQKTDEKPAEKPAALGTEKVNGAAAVVAQAEEKPVARTAQTSNAGIASQAQPLDHFGTTGRGLVVQRSGASALGPPTTIFASPPTAIRSVPGVQAVQSSVPGVPAQVANLVVKSSASPVRTAAASPPIVPVSLRAASKDTAATAPVSKVQPAGVAEALASKAVLVVPLEKLPEIAAAISTQVSDSPSKKPQQVLLASNGNAPAQKYVQAHVSNISAVKPAPASSNRGAGGATQNASAPAAGRATAVLANTSRGDEPKNLSSSSAADHHGNATLARTNQSASAAVDKEKKSATPLTVNTSSDKARNRLMPSLVNLTVVNYLASRGNLTVAKHQNIVKRTIPLKPMQGKLDLRGNSKTVDDKKGAGLVTKTVAARKAAVENADVAKHAGGATKDKKKDPYDGFLSKFIA